MQVQAQCIHVLTSKNPKDIARDEDCDPSIFGFATFMTCTVLYCEVFYAFVEVFLGRININSSNVSCHWFLRHKGHKNFVKRCLT